MFPVTNPEEYLRPLELKPRELMLKVINLMNFEVTCCLDHGVLTIRRSHGSGISTGETAVVDKVYCFDRARITLAVSGFECSLVPYRDFDGLVFTLLPSSEFNSVLMHITRFFSPNILAPILIYPNRNIVIEV